LSITTTAIPRGDPGASYIQQLTATGGTGVYTWSISSGTPPLQIDPETGGLSSEGSLSAGVWPFEVTVQDGSSSATVSYTLVVAPPLSIAPDVERLPDATQGIAYSQQLTASGGSGNYSWEITYEDDGLNLSLSPSSGTPISLSGTPTERTIEALSEIDIRLTDTSNGDTADFSYRLGVNPGLPPSLPPGISAYVLSRSGAIGVMSGNQVEPFVDQWACDEYDGCLDIARDKDGNFVVAAGTQGLVIYDSSGNVITDAEHGTPIFPPSDCEVTGNYTSVDIDSQGDYIVADKGRNHVLRISHVTHQITLDVPFDSSYGTAPDAYVRVDSDGNYILLEDSPQGPDQQLPGPLSLHQITPDGTLSSVTITRAENTPLPTSTSGFTFDAAGNYVDVDPYNETIFTIAKVGSPSAGNASVLSTGQSLSDPRGIVRDRGTGRYFLVDDSENTLYSFDADGGNFAQIGDYDEFDLPASLVLVSSIPAGNTDYVLHDNLTVTGIGANTVTLPCSNSTECQGEGYDLAMDASGNFIIASSAAIIRMTPAGDPHLVASAPEGSKFVSVAVDSAGNYVVADSGTTTHRIIRMSPDGASIGNPVSYRADGTSDFEDALVRIDSQGNYIVAEDFSPQGGGPVHLHKITPGGTVTDVPLSGQIPDSVGGLTIDANGNYIISDIGNASILSITPAGAGTLLYRSIEGETLQLPFGLAREKATGKILIANEIPNQSLESFTPPVGQLYAMAADGSSISLLANMDTAYAVLSVAFSVTTTSLPSVAAGQTYSPVTLTAVGGTPAYTWQATGLPAGMSVSQAGVLSGQPSAGGTFTVHLTVTDSTSRSATADLSLLVSGGTTSPGRLSITTGALPAGTAGTAYGLFQLSAAGGSGAYSWSMIGTPAGLSLSSSGALSGTPSVAGNFPVTVSVASAGRSAQQSYTLSIAPGSLSIQGPADLGRFAAPAAISAAYAASGGASPYQFAAAGLPAGLSLDSGGHLTGGVTQPGNYTFAVQATDAHALTTTLNVSVSVLGVNVTSLPDAANNIPYSQTLSAIGGSAPYIWALSGALPPGLTLSSSGVLTGTPVLSDAAPQTFTFAVSVSSAGVTASTNLSLTVSLQPGPLSIPGAGLNPIELPDGALGAGYSQALQAAGGVPPYSWNYQAGNLPDGLSIDSSGNVSGIPAKASIFAFTAQVRDSAGATVSGGFSIRIHPNALRLTNGSLPSGIADTAYPTQAFAAEGGVAPYTFTENGALPAGLTFTNGEIGGTPSAVGNSAFTVTVADSSGLTASSDFRISVTPAHSDLILSKTSLSYSFNAGAEALPFGPSTAVVSVGANTPQSLGFTTAISPAVPWLSVSGGNRTPDTIGVSLTNQALTLAAGTYRTSVVVTCASAGDSVAPCAGTSQSIDVSLTIVNAPPRIVASPLTLTFFAQTTDPETLSDALVLENAGAGVIAVNSVTAAESYISVSDVPATLTASESLPVTVTVNSNGLSAGVHQGSILVNTSAGSVSVPVTLLVSDGAQVTLNPSGAQFQMVAGAAPGNADGSFSVFTGSDASVNWSASINPGSPWLGIDSVTQPSASAPGSVHYSITPAAASLAPNAYYGTIHVTPNSADTAPRDYLVVLNVTPKTNQIQPDPEPGGLVFIYDGTAVLPSQIVNVYAGSANPISYAAQTDSSWLSVAPSKGITSSGAPDTAQVSVNLGILTPGIYRGGVSFEFTGPGVSTDVRTVNVTLIYKGAPETPAARTGLRPLDSAGGCSATGLVPTATGLTNAFSQPAAWPTPIRVHLTDNCGVPVPKGQVVMTFSNGDAPLPLSRADSDSGNYIGTWTPRHPASQISIAARASASGFQPATIQIGGQVVPNAAPVLTPDGTLNAFAPVLGAAVAPGTIVQIYGSNLGAQPAIASDIPLPTKMNASSVLIGGITSPLYYVSSGQVNAQVPFELAPGQQYQVMVNANGALSAPIPLLVSAQAPGIAAFPAGAIIAQHLDGRLVSDDAPAAPNEIIVFYVAGMGLTDKDVVSGAASPAADLARPLDTPKVTLGDIPVTDIIFAGLTPTLVGLYQVDFRVPANAPNGDLTLVLSQTNGQSNATVIAVHN
ncbi:MAG TPA: putative Ig domain-containing protein, partial [Bryobacteraceae bacterium]|nr:putative Ig domain-containing protein [Bryobacteraceae bacterium]